MKITNNVIINAAGQGSRLGHNMPKSLVKVGDLTILEWQIRFMCKDMDSLSIVVGFKGDEVAKHAKDLRSDIKVFFNTEWETTKTGGSLSLAAKSLGGRCVSLDGDLLVAPSDFRSFAQSDVNLIGVTKPNSSQPVYVDVLNDQCCGFSYEKITRYEWTGLYNFNCANAVYSAGNVYEIVEKSLPVSVMRVKCLEIDTSDDLFFANKAVHLLF